MILLWIPLHTTAMIDRARSHSHSITFNKTVIPVDEGSRSSRASKNFLTNPFEKPASDQRQTFTETEFTQSKFDLFEKCKDREDHFD